MIIIDKHSHKQRETSWAIVLPEQADVCHYNVSNRNNDHKTISCFEYVDESYRRLS